MVIESRLAFRGWVEPPSRSLCPSERSGTALQPHQRSKTERKPRAPFVRSPPQSTTPMDRHAPRFCFSRGTGPSNSRTMPRVLSLSLSLSPPHRSFVSTQANHRHGHAIVVARTWRAFLCPSRFRDKQVARSAAGALLVLQHAPLVHFRFRLEDLPIDFRGGFRGVPETNHPRNDRTRGIDAEREDCPDRSV